ncbi:hypothetical protein [Pseudobutyrivibrio sp. LB2011]|uniref:hypothetical protein n=1 Tax=Pseudobutyrivibrio sp. LB2011 TaxID=1408312 RepID=UPI0005D24BC4|nr:hypothetical protein [Pseudobutyrivibrio sp. LB2011]
MDLYLRIRYLIMIGCMLLPAISSLVYTPVKVYLKRIRRHTNTIFDYIINLFMLMSGVIVSGIGLAQRTQKMEWLCIGYSVFVIIIFIYEIISLRQCEEDLEDKI